MGSGESAVKLHQTGPRDGRSVESDEKKLSKKDSKMSKMV